MEQPEVTNWQLGGPGTVPDLHTCSWPQSYPAPFSYLCNLPGLCSHSICNPRLKPAVTNIKYLLFKYLVSESCHLIDFDGNSEGNSLYLPPMCIHFFRKITKLRDFKSLKTPCFPDKDPRSKRKQGLTQLLSG